MLKFFLFILLIVGIYYLLFRKKTDSANHSKQKPHSIMLECVECGTYVSNEEVIIKNGKYYCSKECAKLH
ncbi:PP0621 family protein [uncultured Helicobacter sp.]|uniref:PP0621 family protein n=1 Tax=uncultured Helicobacter sp. TaxID=175537 RepID=UPI002620C780|nr:PP0621 family protein [uncultured Helicobacter sp.]